MNAWQLLLTLTAVSLTVLTCGAVTLNRTEHSTSLRHGVILNRIQTVTMIITFAAAYTAAITLLVGVWVGFATGWAA